MGFKIAENSMREEIIENMKIGFEESDKYVRYFFDNRVDFNNCIVCVEDNKIVSSLHMIPAKIRGENGPIPVDYIYAATTLPAYRLKGYMSRLLKKANRISYLRGNKASILIPANEKLFGFYSKLGYATFYKYKKIIINNSQMKSLIQKRNITFDNFYFENIFDTYTKNHSNLGDVIWNKYDVKFAFDMNKFLGGMNVYTKYGYAMCYIQKQDTIKVAEFSTTHSDVYNLLGNIYSKFPNYSFYKIILPTNHTHINIEGKIFNHGMIKPYTSELKCFVAKLRSNTDPYFSFTLE